LLQFLRKTGIKSKTRTLLKPVYQSVTNRAGDSVPVFLTGCGRSGTNFLVSQLDRFWNVELFNEADARAFEKWRLRDFSEVRKLVSRSFAEYVLFKPINDTYRMTRLLEEFPDAKIIFQYRHYNDVVNSILRGPFGSRKHLVGDWVNGGFQEFSRYPPTRETQNELKALYRKDLDDASASALYWWLQNRFLFDQHLEADPRVLMIGYEHMVTDAKAAFASACTFLGLEFSPKVLRRVSHSSLKKNREPYLEERIKEKCTEMMMRILAANENRGVGTAERQGHMG